MGSVSGVFIRFILGKRGRGGSVIMSVAWIKRKVPVPSLSGMALQKSSKHYWRQGFQFLFNFLEKGTTQNGYFIGKNIQDV